MALTREEKQKIIKLYENHAKITEIMRQTGRSRDAIKSLLRVVGLDIDAVQSIAKVLAWKKYKKNPDNKIPWQELSSEEQYKYIEEAFDEEQKTCDTQYKLIMGDTKKKICDTEYSLDVAYLGRQIEKLKQENEELKAKLKRIQDVLGTVIE